MSTHTNPAAKTYAGNACRIVEVARTSAGRRLYALKNAAYTLISQWDGIDELERYARMYYQVIVARPMDCR